ncbi:hypothetical protein CLAIMM_03878 [Cladophialophora immunda]|nr:hypothetical protein CLAIMM_03878 [Cladophialophora immunda]
MMSERAAMDPVISRGVALITGSGSGIGQQIALCFAKKGCSQIFLVDLSEPGMLETKSLIREFRRKVKVVIHKADVSSSGDVKAMVDKCVETFGRIDFAANNAGITSPVGLTTDLDVATFDKLHNVNTKGVYNCHRHEIGQMLKQDSLTVEGVKYGYRGCIVNTASMCGLAVQPLMSAYNSTKHGVVLLTRCDARDFATSGIRINCVCPGIVNTPILETAELSQHWIMEQSPMRRVTEASEIAEAVVFLCGSGATAITGISMPVDTGMLLYHIV